MFSECENGVQRKGTEMLGSFAVPHNRTQLHHHLGLQNHSWIKWGQSGLEICNVHLCNHGKGINSAVFHIYKSQHGIEVQWGGGNASLGWLPCLLSTRGESLENDPLTNCGQTKPTQMIVFNQRSDQGCCWARGRLSEHGNALAGKLGHAS